MDKNEIHVGGLDHFVFSKNVIFFFVANYILFLLPLVIATKIIFDVQFILSMWFFMLRKHALDTCAS